MIQLLYGDCLKLMFDLPDNSVDMVCCDMPFGTTACHWDSVLPLDMIWYHYKRICKDNGAIVLNASQPFTTDLINSNRKWFKYCWVWEKDKPNNFALANKQPMKYHEDVVIFYEKQPTYNKQMIPRSEGGKSRCAYVVDHSNRKMQGVNLDDSLKNGESHYCPEMKNPSTIIFHNTGRRQDSSHPTQKPVALIEYLIKTYTNKGDTVLDNCMGSGTTGVACQNLNRNFIGIELDDKYFQIAKERIEATETGPELETA